MKSKRIIAFCLFVFMLFQFVVPSVFAAEITEGVFGKENSLKWSYNTLSGALTIQPTDKDVSGVMEDFPEAKQSPWEHVRHKISTIDIEEGVTNIGNWAFGYHTRMYAVNLPESLKKIGTSAFYYCQMLEEVLIPETVTTLKGGIFSYCTALESVSIPQNIKLINSWTFHGCTSLKNVYYNGTESDWNNVIINKGNVPLENIAPMYETKAGIDWNFDKETGKLTISGYGRTKNYTAHTTPWTEYENEITSVVVEEGVTGLGIYSLGYFKNATSISLPSTLVHIGANTFYKWQTVTEIDIPETVRRLDNAAFAYCYNLKSVVIPNKVSRIDNNTFLKCNALESVSYDGTKVQWSKIVKSTKGNDVLFTFIENNQVKYLVDSVVWTFDDETGTLTLSGGVRMDDYVLKETPAFEEGYYDKVKTIIIEEGIPNIGDNAFTHFTNVEEVVIPEGVTSIGNTAFYNCSSLKTVVMPNTVTTIGSGTFSGCKVLESVQMSTGMTFINTYAFNECTALNTVYYPADSEKWEAIDIREKGNDCLLNVNLVFDEMPDFWTFDEATGTLTITGEMEDYEQGTAPWYDYAANIKNIVLDSAVTKIGTYAFAGTAVESYTVPDGFETISSGAFANCGALKEITIPSDVISVDANAFSGCTALETVNYCGTRADFEKVNVADGNDPLLMANFNFEIYQGEMFAKKFTNDYLYRVGNVNAVKLGYLFDAAEGMSVDSKTVNVTVTKLVDGTDVAYTYTKDSSDWKNSTIKFEGTGPVLVSISDISLETNLSLEVVNAANVTTYGELKNITSVLLCDIEMTSNDQSYYISNATLYGNGFTFDVSKGKYKGDILSSNYLVYLTNANIDNIKIVGAVYTQYGATVSSSYNNATVLSSENSTIKNSYISNCASPVRLKDGNLEIINSTLKGGNFANLDIRNGNVTLENVTTINQVDSNDKSSDGKTVVGFGIVAYYENVLDTTTITINGNLNQYNNLKETDVEYLLDPQAKILFDKMFDTSFNEFIYTNGSEKWVNAGVISMSNDVGQNNIIENRKDHNYKGKTATLTGINGYVYTTVAAAPASAPEYISVGNASVAPSYSFDFTSKNYIAKTEGSNKYCYAENGKVLVSFDEGDSIIWDTSILTVTKLGNNLDYTVSVNGTDYTGKQITFDTTGDYAVKYTYTDPYNYKLDADGNVVSYSETYTKTVNVSVSAVKAAAKNAEFTFGSNGTASRKETIGNNTYVMPDVSATSSTIGSTTVEGKTVYYPIVEIIMSDGKTSHTSGWYAYFPVFENAVTITDYADEGTGNAVTYGATTQAMPSNLSVVGDPTSLFKYQSSSAAGATPVVKNRTLVYSSPSISATRKEFNTFIQYSYKDNAGQTYYYYIGYHAPAQSYTSCVTPDTLITLADGTQKQVQHLTGDETLLVFNHTTGKLDIAPIAYIVDHNKEVSEQTVITLGFDDGRYVDIIGEHVFFDMDSDKYVTLDENAEKFIGTTFAVMSENSVAGAKLVSVTKQIKETATYEVVTYKNVTCFTNGILSASAYLDKVLNVFDINEDTKAYENVAEDIEKYGLYTYADFEGLISEDAFELYNAKYLKIAVGKGYITWDDILELIDIFFAVDVKPIN